MIGGALPVASIVVLNWHNEEATRQCVDSLLALRCDGLVEIIVVDNGSTDESRAGLAGLASPLDASRAKTCRVVELIANAGFAGGMNAGVAAASAPVVALLNNDLVVGPDWLEIGLAVMAGERVALVGGKSYYWDDENPVWCTDNEACTVARIDAARGYAQLLTEDVERCDVATLDGNNMLVRRDAWERLSGFDEDFFAYLEDGDLCARALALGYRIVYEPDMHVWHRRNLSSNRVRIKRVFWTRRNRLYFIARHFPEDRWRRLTVAAGAEYLALGLIGHEGGLRGRLGGSNGTVGHALAGSTRLGNIAAAGWMLTHWSRLKAKRRQVIAAGQHDEAYRDKIRSLYEPFPLGSGFVRRGSSGHVVAR